MAEVHLGYLGYAIVNAFVGVLIFGISFAVLSRLMPYRLWKEIGENKNVALAVLVGALSIGMSIIIATAVH